MDIVESLPDFVSPVILWAAFFAVGVFFVIVTAALMYHWKNYNIDNRKSRKVMRIYFGVSGIFIFIMLISVMAYAQ